MKNKILITTIIIVAAGLAIFWQIGSKGNTIRKPPVVNTENTGNEAQKKDLIKITSPRPNDVIKSPLAITGEARGNWYFEASFPVVLTDWDGKIIAQGHAKAQGAPGDWMTTEFVPFKATLLFTKPAYNNNGTLILRKDNASGLPEHDDALEIPIKFAR